MAGVVVVPGSDVGGGSDGSELRWEEGRGGSSG